MFCTPFCEVVTVADVSVTPSDDDDVITSCSDVIIGSSSSPMMTLSSISCWRSCWLRAKSLLALRWLTGSRETTLTCSTWLSTPRSFVFPVALRGSTQSLWVPVVRLGLFPFRADEEADSQLLAACCLARAPRKDSTARRTMMDRRTHVRTVLPMSGFAKITNI